MRDTVEKLYKNHSKEIYTAAVAALLILGAFVRVFKITSVPGGINQDEAFAGYEALSLLRYGTDSWGYSFPVYFVSWGSGMNVLYSYLTIPLAALFGMSTTVMRMPQAIVGVLTLLVVWLLVKNIFNKKIALLCLFLTAICPWHIMMSRWGLESNFAPAFMLFGLYFFIKGTEDTRFYIASACFYGLTLYAYATVWVVVPFVLVLQLLYCFYTKKLKTDKYFFIAIAVLAVISLPLILFVLINLGYADEIRTPFLSVPKLAYMRVSDISFSEMGKKFKHFMEILLLQQDDAYWNSTGRYGIYYRFSAPFGILGFVYMAVLSFLSIKKRSYDGSVFVVIQFIASVLLGSLVYVNINRINIVHICILVFCSVGLYITIKSINSCIKYMGYTFIFVYICLFIGFISFYFTAYNNEISRIFQKGLGEAVAYAEKISEEDDIIHVSGEYIFPKILFYSQIPTPEYISTVEFDAYPAAFVHTKSFGHYRTEDSSQWPNGENGIYIVNNGYEESFSEQGYKVVVFDNVAVAYK